MLFGRVSVVREPRQLLVDQLRFMFAWNVDSIDASPVAGLLDAASQRVMATSIAVLAESMSGALLKQLPDHLSLFFVTERKPGNLQHSRREIVNR